MLTACQDAGDWQMAVAIFQDLPRIEDRMT